MMVHLNGRCVPESEARISVFDRGFLYGDGLFESIRVYRGRPFLWDAHCDRLLRGAKLLGIRLPTTTEALRQAAEELLERNQLPDAILRIAVSRAPGLFTPRRGNAHRGPHHPPGRTPR